MRKVISILLIFLVLLATVHLSIASHYCGGELAAVKYSLSGEKASCGMEDSIESCPLSSSIKGHCCSDHLTVVSTDQNYISNFSIHNIVQKTFQFFAMPVDGIIGHTGISHTIQNFLNRHSVFRASEVLLDFICTFRI